MQLSMFTQSLLVLFAVFIMWRLFVYVRAHPETLSKENLSRSFSTLGVLALLLIVFVAGLVWLVK